VAALPPAPESAPPQADTAPKVHRPLKAAAPKRAAPPRLAALPPSNAAPDKPSVTDAPPIIVLRGGPRNHYALAGSSVPALTITPVSAAPSVRVMRCARPRPTGLEGRVQPGPLILRLSD